MKIRLISALVMAATAAMATNVMAECGGNVYAMNAGRGHTGILVDVQESKRITDIYASNAAILAQFKSRTLFSATAMAFDTNTDRIYYVSSPRPKTYHVTGQESVVSADELKNLDWHAKTLEPIQLAYYDTAADTHTLVGTVPETLRMIFHPTTGELYASDRSKIYKIDPDSGATTAVANFPNAPQIDGSTSWGDFVFHDNELLFITNVKTYAVDTASGALTAKANHYINYVSAVTLDQNGQVLLAAKNQNVNGNVNSTILWRIKPSTGEKRQVGLFPTRMSAMATHTGETHTCYEETVFPSDLKPDLSGISANSASVTEGQTAAFTVSFSKATPTGTTTPITLALLNGSAVAGSDYSTSVSINYSSGGSQNVTLTSTGTTVNIPAGVTSLTVNVPTVNDSTHESNEYFTLQGWFKADKSDLASANVTIVDNDPDIDAQLRAAAQNSGVAWHGSRGAGGNDQWIRGVHANINGTIPSGTTIEFYRTGNFLRSYGINSGGQYYEQHANHERVYYAGDVAWARLKGPNGVYYNVRTGHRAYLHNNVNVDCSGGCWSKR